MRVWLYWYFRNEKKEKTVVGCKASSFIPLSSNSCVCVCVCVCGSFSHVRTVLLWLKEVM